MFNLKNKKAKNPKIINFGKLSLYAKCKLRLTRHAIENISSPTFIIVKSGVCRRVHIL